MSKTILAPLWMHTMAGRRHLAGIYRYIASKGRDWDIHLVKIALDLTPERLQKLIDGGLDGIIAAYGGYYSSLNKVIAKAKIPTVLLDVFGDERHVHVNSNEEALGGLAAQHLLELGNFRTFACVPHDDQNAPWSFLRVRGFVNLLTRKGRTVMTKRTKEPAVDWLRKLEKPAAIFCVSDAIAANILHIATEANIRIPDDCAVLGVDDDEIVCDNIRPALSSIRPGHETCGYAAAEILDRILHRKKVRNVLIAPEKIVCRASTSYCTPATTLVNRTLLAINEHAKDGWSVNDIAKAVGVSRRLLSLRFAELQGQSVHEALIVRRLFEAERLLKLTSLKIKDVTLRAGFGNINYLKGLFKKRYGVTMRAFRQASAHAASARGDKEKRKS